MSQGNQVKGVCAHLAWKASCDLPFFFFFWEPLFDFISEIYVIDILG